MNNHSAHAHRTQVDPKTIDIELKGIAWVGGRLRKKSVPGLYLTLLEEILGRGYPIYKKFVRETSMLPRKREGKSDKWLVNGMMQTVRE